MEALNQSNYTKALVADVAIERASQEGFSICKSMKVKKSYSWMWDGKNTDKAIWNYLKPEYKKL